MKTESKGTRWDKQNKKQTPSHTDAKASLLQNAQGKLNIHLTNHVF